MEITKRQMLECAERELKLRKRVYPRRASEGRMSPGFATEQIRLMEAIVEHLRPLAEADDAKGRLL